MSRRRFALPQRASSQPPDDSGCTVLHVDMDAFYAAASLLSRPELVGTPVIVGGGTRGVVLSATYEARACGVASAMPMSRARRLCPQATVLAPEHALYARLSSAVMEIFGAITPVVEPLSLDEAFLDVAGARRRLGGPAYIGELIRGQVREQLGLTCSVGVASTKFVAKLASGLAKPDGLVVVPPEEVVGFLHQLPVGALWGVGERTEAALARLGLHTVAEVAHTPLPTLERALGEATGRHLHALSWGRDPRRVVTGERERSMGADQTFEVDISDPVELARRLLGLSQKVTSRLRRGGFLARTVSIRVRYPDFRTVSRARTLQQPTDTSRVVFDIAHELLDELLPRPTPVRLIGVRLEHLLPARSTAIQGVLGEADQGWREADRAMDDVGRRFGRGSIRPASLIESANSASHSQEGDLS